MSDGTLQAFLDGELPDGERVGVMRHLAGCAECAAELEVLRAASLDLSSALGWLDSPAPAERAYAGIRQTMEIPRIPPRIGFGDRASALAAGSRRAFVRAAVLVLGLAAAASAAIPGSPLREWIVQTWERVAGGEPAEAPAPIAPAPAARMPDTPRSEPMAGISILPRDGEIRILLESPAPECRVRVRLVDGTAAAVYTVGRAVDARFRTSPGRLVVQGAGAGEVRIDLPRTARAALVTVDGHALAVKDADSLRAIAPALDRSAEELVFRAGF